MENLGDIDFYWDPRRDEVKIRTLNPPDIVPMALPFARCIEEVVGPSHEVIPRVREPVGPYRLLVEAQRVRHVRFNDLIDPQVLPLDTPMQRSSQPMFRSSCSSRGAIPIRPRMQWRPRSLFLRSDPR